MSLFVSRGFLCGFQSHSLLFLVQQLTSWPLSVHQCQWDWESGRSLSSVTNAHIYRHAEHTLYFKTTANVRGEWDVPNSLCGVGTLLNGGCLVSPYSEVTLSLQSALHMNWALCQWLVKFISEAEVRVWGHPGCWMPSYNPSVLHIHYSHTEAHTHYVFCACPHKHTHTFMDPVLVHTVKESLVFFFVFFIQVSVTGPWSHRLWDGLP